MQMRLLLLQQQQQHWLQVGAPATWRLLQVLQQHPSCLRLVAVSKKRVRQQRQLLLQLEDPQQMQQWLPVQQSVQVVVLLRLLRLVLLLLQQHVLLVQQQLTLPKRQEKLPAP